MNPPTAQAVYLAARDRLLVPEGRGGATPAQVATFARNLESLGYTLSEPAATRLLSCSAEEVARLYDEAVAVLRRKVGAHRPFAPMYPNFPAQVLEASAAELYFNALRYYWSVGLAEWVGIPGLVWRPVYEKAERPPLDEAPRLRVIDLGTEAEFERLFTQLAAANGAIAPADREVVAWFAACRRADLERLLPETIPNKENLAHLVSLVAGDDVPARLAAMLRTATDVLRVAVALCAGDVSLAAPTRFRSFRRAERRFLLGALEGCAQLTEDMLRSKGYWIRLGERLHPGERKARYPKTFEAFTILRENAAFERFNTGVEEALAARDVARAAALLAARPGEMARRLDHLLRLGGAEEADAAARAFLAVADGVSTPVLVQLFHHFATRGEPRALRAFFPKGNTARMHVTREPLPEFPAEVARAVAGEVRAVLVRRFAALPPLGRVYVDEALRAQNVPFGLRSASKALRTLARGSRLPLPDADTLRLFLWWREGAERTDIDLSAVFYCDGWTSTAWVSYFDLRGHGCAHSGDIVEAPDGACEFIDVDRRRLRESGFRYVSMVLNSYTRQAYKDLPECFAGWMARAAPDSGEVFDARTVEHRVDVASDSTVCIPVVFDLEAGEAVWTDLALRSMAVINNVATNDVGIGLMTRAMVELSRPTLYDLFLMHAEARGTPQGSPAGADTVFSLADGITPFDTEKILSEFLA